MFISKYRIRSNYIFPTCSYLQSFRVKMKNGLRYPSSANVVTSCSIKRALSIIMKKNNGVKDICILCKDKKCLVDHSVNKVYSGRITRSISKWLKYLNSFVVTEMYRSMPLLGDEEDIPNWDVHLVRYSVTFSDNYT